MGQTKGREVKKVRRKECFTELYSERKVATTCQTTERRSNSGYFVNLPHQGGELDIERRMQMLRLMV